MANKQTFKSDISHQEFPVRDKVSAKAIRTSILELIQKEHPEFSKENYLSITELNRYREQFISGILIQEVGELSELEQTVLSAVTDHSILSEQEDLDTTNRTTYGQRVADKVAVFGGSWRFIIMFGCFILIWIAANIYWLSNKGFDPYPFILLNLILSCLAALQAPVIMMSQNRTEEKDRERAKNDYMINLKSELEIRMLHEKIDHMIMHQQQELMEVQKVQMDMMRNIMEHMKIK